MVLRLREISVNAIIKIDGNIFRADMEFINFMQTCLQNGSVYTIILDINNNPVKITDIKECLKTLLEVYYKAYDEYFDKYETLKKARNIKKVIS